MRSIKDPVTEIRIAAKNLTLVSISYQDSKGNFSERLVEPYEIKNGSLFAYCTERESIRNFKLSQINAAYHSTIKFNPRWPVNI